MLVVLEGFDYLPTAVTIILYLLAFAGLIYYQARRIENNDNK
jgi:hypothetical protein